MGHFTSMMSLLGFLLLVYPPGIYSIYLPGLTPTEFKKGDSVEIDALKLFSQKTQIPYDYYSIKQCEPKDKISYEPESIGSILRGDRLVNTPYNVKMATDQECQLLCNVEYSNKRVNQLIDFIEKDYYVQLSADSLPSATKWMNGIDTKTRYAYGHSLGSENDGIFINNHLEFHMQYHDIGNGNFRLVGFEVIPRSIDPNKMNFKDGKCSPPSSGNQDFFRVEKDKLTQISYSYEVHWTASDIKWASRWDIFLISDHTQIHWLSILNSILIILLLTAVLAMIMIRALRRDIAKYNRDEDAEDVLEESGWKLIHGDVFRPPRFPRVLAAILGSGVQLFCMVFAIIFFSVLGMISPASRGTLMTATIFTYVFMGVIAGYFAGRMYKTIKGINWKSAAILTGVFYPAIMLSIAFFLNVFLWSIGSSAGVPFGTFMAILALWCLVSLPLVCVGFFFGFRKRPYEQPVRTNQIPRAVPLQSFKQNLFMTSLLAGAMPFAAMSVELFFIMSALWNKQIYYLFGFLLIVFIIYTICCAQIAVVLTYFQLCNENYHWWWRSLIISGGAAIYIFGYTVYYFMTQLTISGAIPVVIYFGHSLIISVSMWILSATIGFYAVFFFLRKIYAAIKID